MCSWACVATKVGDFLRRPLVMSDENVLVAAPRGFVIMRHPLPTHAIDAVPITESIPGPEAPDRRTTYRNRSPCADARA